MRQETFIHLFHELWQTKRREPEIKGQIVKDEQEATTRRLIYALPMSHVIILLNIPS